MSHEGGRSQVCEQATSGDQGPHHIDGKVGVRLFRLREADARMPVDQGKQKPLLLRIAGHRMGPKILQEFQILDVERMILR